jgi:hypothetical protein
MAALAKTIGIQDNRRNLSLQVCEMNISMKRRMATVLASATAIAGIAQCPVGANEPGTKSACELKVLNRKGCEVGDFDRQKIDPPSLIKDKKHLLRGDWEAPADEGKKPSPTKPNKSQSVQKTEVKTDAPDKSK